MQTLDPAERYDVCIVGSGAGGSMAAKVLAEGGAKVVLLEAGQRWTVEDDAEMLTWNYASPRRGASTTKRPFGEFDACDGGWEIAGEPYAAAEGTDWRWWRARMLGGRTNHWGRISLRFGPDDFRGKTLDGHGDDWPIGYDDVAPYYDRVDRLVGIFGSRDGFPNEPDGVFLPPPEPRCYEKRVMRGAESIGIPVLSSRLSILTEAKPEQGRAACHYCGQCNRGCSVGANFSAGRVLLDPALETGNLTVVTGAMAREVLTDDEGRATGVSYIDVGNLEAYEVQADIVVLAASACESARLLLNSKSARHPNGLANSSDVVGRYVMDTVGAGASAFVPALANQPAHNCDGVGGMHIYIPWWLHDQHANLDFPRGYHLETWGGRGMPGFGYGWGIEGSNGDWGERPRGGGGYGAQLKDDYRRVYAARVGFAGRGEMIARADNRCEIDPGSVDRFGIPTLTFDVTWGDEEIRQARHMQQAARELLESIGGEIDEMPTEDSGYGISKPGEIIHEAGVVRMGADPATSALNGFCQAHDADNVFVVDAAPFVSQPHKNTTWTILALSWRAADYILDQRKQRAI
ncbi:GMC family oxidoreductase [Rubrivirga sp. IMCC43871]|uniref:GMC family oxidoreductase n=1 Tax=Rubrivirga sp. IMCC43871 TaxID=3391575 RepID=UPI00398FB7AB